MAKNQLKIKLFMFGLQPCKSELDNNFENKTLFGKTKL